MKRLVVGSLVAVVALGCDSVSAPGGAQFAFVAHRLNTFVDKPAITLSSTSGRVLVLGGLWVGCGGAEISGHATTNDIIKIDVVADAGSRDKACFAMVESFAYTAVVSGLAAGTYRVQVRHMHRWWDADPKPEITRTEHFVARVGGGQHVARPSCLVPFDTDSWDLQFMPGGRWPKPRRVSHPDRRDRVHARQSEW